MRPMHQKVSEATLNSLDEPDIYQEQELNNVLPPFRGTADTCKIMLIGEGDESPSEHGQGADASGALAGSTGGGPSSSSTRPSPAEPKKRKRKDETDELAARVQQLETIIRMQTQLQAGHLRGDETPEDNTDAKSEQSAVEEAAVAALGQLSKAMPKEGGTEARIYSGPGSVTDFVSPSSETLDSPVVLKSRLTEGFLSCSAAGRLWHWARYRHPSRPHPARKGRRHEAVLGAYIHLGHCKLSDASHSAR